MISPTYAITLMGEEGIFYWEDGKIAAQGYDLENEKAALALSGNVGRGIGTLLVAIDEFEGTPGWDLEEDLRLLNEDIDVIYELHDLGRLARMGTAWKSSLHSACSIPYLSYDPDVIMRSWAVSMAEDSVLNERQCQRLINEWNEDILQTVIPIMDVPVERQIILARHPSPPVRLELAISENLSPSAMMILAYDEDDKVYEALRVRKDLPTEVEIALIDSEMNSLQKNIEYLKKRRDKLQVSLGDAPSL